MVDDTYLALGRAIAAFSRLEIQIFRLVFRLIDSDLLVGRRLTRRMTFGPLAELARDLVRIRVPHADTLADMLTHALSLNEMRNKYVHATWYEEEGIVKRMVLASKPTQDLFAFHGAARPDQLRGLEEQCDELARLIAEAAADIPAEG